MKLSANTLKFIAIIAMTIDHVALLFVPMDSLLYVIMRVIGRLTAPMMCYFIAEGFRHTRSRRKYLMRMVIFAVIAQPAYSLMIGGGLRLNVMYTFAVSLVMLMILSGDWRINVYVQTLLFAVCICLSMLGDWGYLIPLWVLVFYRFRGDFRKQSLFFFSTTIFVVIYQYLSAGVPLYQLAVLLALIPLSLYSGERGGSAGNLRKISKWGFYVYYALHIAVLVIIKSCL